MIGLHVTVEVYWLAAQYTSVLVSLSLAVLGGFKAWRDM